MKKLSDKIRPLMPRVYTFIIGMQLLLKHDSYLRKIGWLDTHRRGIPCNVDGKPIPWMNYPMIAFLENRLSADLNLFEYGSGFSTMFYSARVKNVTSIEYDRAWYDRLKEQVDNNVKLLFCEYEAGGAYCRAALETRQKYDVIVVDGRDRVRCAVNAFEALSDQGVIIFDDSTREKYQEGIKYYLDKGFRKLEFEGIKPKGLGLDRTSILYRSENCFGI